jgi:hypothetical protein
MRLVLSALCLLLGAGCTGCSGIDVKKASDNPGLRKGVPWNLPMTQFTLTITRHITSCSPDVYGTVEAVVSSSLAPDPDQQYLLTSNGWFATSDISSSLTAAGYSSSLNAQSADATATVIANVIGMAAQIAVGAAAGAPDRAPPPLAKDLCSNDVSKAISVLYPPGNKKLQEVVDDDSATLAKATAKVALLTAQNAADKRLKGDLVKALSEQDAAQQMLTEDQKKLADNLKITTDTQVVTWPTKGGEFRRPGELTLPDSVWNKWTKKSAASAYQRNFDVDLAIYIPDATSSKWIIPSAAPSAGIKAENGVPVRVAQPAHLLICAASAKTAQVPAVECPKSIDPLSPLADGITVADVRVLQLGTVYLLPVSGGAFRSEAVTVSLDANGNPATLETSEKVAAAAALSGSLKDSATQLAALPASVRAAELAKTQAETNQINANVALSSAQLTASTQGQTNVATATAALVNAQNSLATAKQNAGLSALQQESGALSAQTAVLNAQAALANAQQNATVVDQTGALSAQTALINAQTTLINAEAARAKAQIVVP